MVICTVAICRQLFKMQTELWIHLLKHSVQSVTKCIPLSRDTPILRMRIITDDSFRQVETCALSIVLGRLSDIQVIHQSFIVRSRYPRHLVILSREQKIQS